MTDPLVWIPRSDPVARIRQMPALVAEIEALGGTRNPDGETTHTRTVPGSRPPLDVSRLDVVASDGWEPSSLVELSSVASRIIWQAVDPDTRTAHPQPCGLSWNTECAWLADIWADSRAWLDDVDMGIVDQVVHQTYSTLTRQAGVRPPTRISCPSCGASMQLVGQGVKAVLVCEATAWSSDRHEMPGPAALELQWRYHRAMTADELGECDLPVTCGQIRQWRKRGRLRPALRSQHRGDPHHYWPWDVIRLLWPGIIEAIDARDARGAA
ncbi:hypothetical protein [Acidipropionibacterium timonense]|uniref:hypothetical protein n=1 Tax=Acidipropionibacterium timonense TaxID=2161818 RepID=UPI0010308783|nr:hypothetical protein [Acidipropionibacterium timonense]